MNVILPKEVFMEQNLTWQVVLFIALGAVQVVALILWTLIKAADSLARCVKSWKEVVK